MLITLGTSIIFLGWRVGGWVGGGGGIRQFSEACASQKQDLDSKKHLLDFWNSFCHEGLFHQPCLEWRWDLTQTNANESVAMGVMTIRVESHAQETCTSWRGTEVRRLCVIAPAITHLGTITRVTWNEESSVERGIADQQLVMESIICSYAVPLSIGASSLSIVISRRYGLVDLSLEVGLVSSLVVDKHDFCKLK